MNIFAEVVLLLHFVQCCTVKSMLYLQGASVYYMHTSACTEVEVHHLNSIPII